MFSEDRLSHVSHLLQDRIWKDDLVDFPDDGAALREIKRVLHKYFSTSEEVDQIVRQRIYSQRAKVIEGSTDWDILYNKYFEEELTRRRF